MKITDKYTNFETANTYDFFENDYDVINTAAVYYSMNRTAWRDFWPYSGESLFLYAETSEKMFGGTKNYGLLEADFRKHFDLSRAAGRNMSVSMRLLYAMTIGEDRPYFRFGGLNTVRGVGYGRYSGDKVMVLNTEFRHTIVKNMDFELWPLNFFVMKNLKFFAFLDSGIVKSGDIDFIVNEDIKTGMGVGFILDTFLLQKQYFPFKFEFAKRTDIGDTDWRFYFSINTGF
ncbi:MAG TPA: hypothetical protein ENN55_04405 [Firmicutes bacterium]|nr:hypothetical protein [Bacillota bacterium]